MEKIAQGHGQETRKCAPVCKVNFAQTFGCNSFLWMIMLHGTCMNGQVLLAPHSLHMH